MNLHALLLLANTKENAIQIRDFIRKNPSLLDELMDFCLSNDSHLVKRSSYALSHIFDVQPELLIPYTPKMLNCILKPDHMTARKRNILRILPLMPIPREKQLILLSRCYKIVLDSSETTAVRANAIGLIDSLVGKQAALEKELKITLEFLLNNKDLSKGMVARIRKTLSQK